jgi:hypothetical protein
MNLVCFLEFEVRSQPIRSGGELQISTLALFRSDGDNQTHVNQWA